MFERPGRGPDKSGRPYIIRRRCRGRACPAQAGRSCAAKKDVEKVLARKELLKT